MTARARGGLGIIPARTQQHGYLWRRAIKPGELEQRLDQAHRPYHRALEEQLSLLMDRFGLPFCSIAIRCRRRRPACRRLCSAIAAVAPPMRWVGAEAMAIADAPRILRRSERSVRRRAHHRPPRPPRPRNSCAAGRNRSPLLSWIGPEGAGRRFRPRRLADRGIGGRAWRAVTRPPVRDGGRISPS